jgi:hypothetical protein
MWSFLIRGGVAVVVLATLWLFTAQSFSLLIDRVSTVPLATLPSTPLGWNGTYLQFGSSIEGMEEPKGGWSGVEFQTGSQIVDLEGPGPGYDQVATLKVDADDKLVLSAGGHRLTLGSRAGTLSGGDGPIPAFAAEPGDKTSVTLERSWLSWPTPFEANFMTGQTPSWRRHLYYRLSWKKASGARLDMLWRFEQRFDAVNGWGAPGTQERTTGLIWVDIRPAPP